MRVVHISRLVCIEGEFAQKVSDADEDAKDEHRADDKEAVIEIRRLPLEDGIFAHGSVPGKGIGSVEPLPEQTGLIGAVGDEQEGVKEEEYGKYGKGMFTLATDNNRPTGMEDIPDLSRKSIPTAMESQKAIPMSQLISGRESPSL